MFATGFFRLSGLHFPLLYIFAYISLYSILFIAELEYRLSFINTFFYLPPPLGDYLLWGDLICIII